MESVKHSSVQTFYGSSGLGDPPPLAIRDNSIAKRISDTGGRSTGFDYLRLALAVSIIVWHSFGISYGLPYVNDLMTGWLRPVIGIIIPLFFALSGFLVAGSLDRSPGLSTFVGLRVLRIFPALIVEVTLSALVLGPLLTEFSLASYFNAPSFHAYFLNILGDIHYELPGLFQHNPYPSIVNGQLWTIPSELNCYLLLTGLALFSLVRRRAVFLTIVGVLCVPFAVVKFFFFFGAVVDPGGLVPANVLVLTFLAAVALYQYRDRVPWRTDLFLLSGLTAIACLSFRHGDYFVPIPVAYATVYMGLLNPRKIWILKMGDYSYGIYLYGFVIQQAVASFGQWTHHWFVNLPISLSIAVIFAGLSWNIVERPALKLKRLLPFLESRIASALPKRRFRAEPGAGIRTADEGSV
jgi:peptidoglycan/LPS O-acetylase OafA/YrhL